MNVFDNVAFPLRMRRRPKQEIDGAVDDALAMVHIEGLRHRMPRELSGGQQQRVALARALVFRPPLLLMDEPLAALDHQLRRQVQAEIKRLHQSLGLTIIFVTHDQEEAMFLSDRIAVMRGGRIVQAGSPAELYAQPVSRFVASFVGDSNLVSGRVLALEGHLARIDIGAAAPVTALAGPGLQRGDEVSCLLRPEKILLNQGGGPDGIEGSVVLASFLGDSMEFEVATTVGTLKVRAPVDAHSASLLPGVTVRLSWAEQDLRALPAEGRA
jgi:ABC-type Fe3+/spermidine/putrescine transport system ATPase subunit